MITFKSLLIGLVRKASFAYFNRDHPTPPPRYDFYADTDVTCKRGHEFHMNFMWDKGTTLEVYECPFCRAGLTFQTSDLLVTAKEHSAGAGHKFKTTSARIG